MTNKCFWAVIFSLADPLSSYLYNMLYWHFWFCTSSLIDKHFIFMCFAPLEFLSLLEKKTVAKLSQWSLNGLAILSTILRPKTKFCNHNSWTVTSKHATNSTYIVGIAITVYFPLFHYTALSASKTYDKYRFFLEST